MGLLAFQKLGQNRDTPRLWIESKRLDQLGFSHGTPLRIDKMHHGLLLRPAILGENHVSSRIIAGGRRPIIDLASQSLLSGLAEYSELKIIASHERIEVTPSHRAFAIQRSRLLQMPLRVLEVFAGGGTMTAACNGDTRFQVVGGVEINPDFADEWQGRNREALLVQADIRSVRSHDLPEFDILIGGIPCTSHSGLGRAKKGLGGKPELGDTGDLFLPALNFVSERMPAAVVFENVPAFGHSLAGELLVCHMKRIGYEVFVTILRPNEDWGEIEDRRRWLLVGTLNRAFCLFIPRQPCVTPVETFLDAPNAILDKADAERIQNTIETLRSHNAWHKWQGHGFGFSVIDGTETRIPTLPASYHKVNSGPFVATPFGPRLLRVAEIERIHGCKLGTTSYSAGVQMLGQGVQTRIFQEIFSQLAAHLVAR